MKKCNKCQQVKNKALFSKHLDTWDKKNPICKCCQLNQFLKNKPV